MTSINTSPSNNVALLKAEGNAFHQSGQYQAAYDKYSEAIKQDPKNAVLWANRAASALSMKKYLDAVYDAKKATTFDPKYAKAWGRQGTGYLALGTWSESINAFKKALNCLPKKQLTPQDQILKNQFDEGLKKAEAGMNCREPFGAYVVPPGSVQKDNLPWTRAGGMVAGLLSQTKINSSAFVIDHAYKSFQEGLDGMSKQKTRRVNGQEAMYGQTGVITSFTNSILGDKRAFHITENDFMDKYNKQIMLEASMSKAWTTGGPKQIQEDALRRLKSSGWGAVRPALALTVRAWIMRGFLQSTLGTSGPIAEFFGFALEMLEWGARTWKNVSREDRGTIFDASFIRGVKRLYMNTLMESYSRNSSNVTLDEIAKVAQEVIDHTLIPPTGEVNPGFFLSFWVYPTADAKVILGWYFMRMAMKESDPEQSIPLYLESAKHYFQGATLFPKDDEFYGSYLKVALEGHWFAGSPLKLTLPICKLIREAIPDMIRIWEYSADSPHRKQWIDPVLAFEKQFTELLAKGEVTLETTAAPDGVPVLQLQPMKLSTEP